MSLMGSPMVINFSKESLEEMHASIVCRSRWLEFIVGVTDRIGITHSIFSRIPTVACTPVYWQERMR